MLRHSLLTTPSPTLPLTKTPHRRQNVAVSSSPTTTTPPYTLSDNYLTSIGYTLHTTPANLNLDDLNRVFVSVGFPKRDPEKIKLALDNTDAMVWVEHSKTSKPVAFARATGDGVFNAVVWDVVVDPAFQGVGLGKAVMERVVGELVRRGVGNIALYSEPRVLGFYRPLGFVSDPDGIKGMVYSRKQKRK